MILLPPKQVNGSILSNSLRERGFHKTSFFISFNFYTSVIRPVLEYAAPVWHHHLINSTQAQQLESIQKRAKILYITLPAACHTPTFYLLLKQRSCFYPELFSNLKFLISPPVQF